MRYLPILFSLLMVAPAWGAARWPADKVFYSNGDNVGDERDTPLVYQVLTLPSCNIGDKPLTVYVDDGSDDADCRDGGQTHLVQCVCNGLTGLWDATGDSGSGGSGGFDSTTEDDLTWSNGLSRSSFQWTFSLIGTEDPILTFSDGLITLGSSGAGTVGFSATGEIASLGGSVVVGSASQAGTLKIYDSTGAGSAVSILASATEFTDWTFRVPPDKGTNLYFLQTDGNGVTSWAPAAPLASPAFTGDPTAPTASADDNDTSIANTAYVQTEIDDDNLGFDDDDSNWTATALGPALEELDDTNAGKSITANSATGKVNWEQIINMPAGFEDGVDAGTGAPAWGDITGINVTVTEIEELVTMNDTTISENQWATLGGLSETLTSTELNRLEGITALSGDNTGDNDQVGAVTDTEICQGDGTLVQCDIGNLAALNTAIGSDLVTGAHTTDGDSISFDDPDLNFAATNVDEAISELFEVNAGKATTANSATGKVDWSQIVNMPAGFEDGTDSGTSLPDWTDIQGITVTQTEVEELATMGNTTISINQWAALGGIAEGLTSTELNLLDGRTGFADLNADGTLSTNTVGLDELSAPAAANQRTVLYSAAGDPSYQTAVPATIGTITDGQLLVGQTTLGEVINKSMTGDASLDSAGKIIVTTHDDGVAFGGFPFAEDIQGITPAITTAEMTQLQTIGTTTISQNQWAALGGISEGLASTELNLLDGLTALGTFADLGSGTNTSASMVIGVGASFNYNTNVPAQFGTAAEGAISWDGTDLVIDSTAGGGLIRMTEAVLASEDGIEFTESDTAIVCTTGDYWIRADLSETTLKKCLNGEESVMDTTGGTPAFSDITAATNTTSAMVVGTGASLVASGSGTIDATEGDTATSFFDAGTIEHERGGLEADVSGYSNGLFGTNGTATIDVDTEGELETALGGLDVVTVTAGDITSAQLVSILSDEGAATTVMQADGTWVANGSTVAELNDVSDVDITTPADFQFLIRDQSTDTDWENVLLSGDVTSVALDGTVVIGNAATVDTNADLTGHITSTGNAAVLGSFTAAQLDTAVSDGNLQPLDTELTLIAGLAETDGNVMFVAGGVWTSDATPAIVGTDFTGTAANLTAGNVSSIAGITLEECFPVYAPSAEIAATDDIESVWRASAALTITEVWCETDTGTVTMDIQIDDGSPADVMGVDLVCAATAVNDTSSLTGGMADGDRLDFLIASVATNPTRLTVCIEYDYD